MAELTTSAPSIGRLLPDDAPAAAALSAAIGWNQVESDWARLVELHPDGAYAARSDQELVGTTTLVRYGDQLAWLGMVIVHPERRGQGIGGKLVDAALADRRAHVVGLDATELGAPIYERRGFVTVGHIDRWAGELQTAPVHGRFDGAREAATADLDRIVRFDAALSGVDRAALIARLVGEPETAVVVAERGGLVVGFAALRPGRERRHVGPVVAVDEGALHALLGELAPLSGGEQVFLDAVRHDGRASALEAFGLSVARSLQRMTRPATTELAMLGRELVAATALEWG